jgi:hypothetical protein
MSEFNVNVSLDAAGMAPVYFRHADRLRLEGCVAGLLRDGRSLALSSNREAALDHYSRLLFARLRESSPTSQLEVYFPADTAAMLARFNEVLATQSVEQAMKLSGQESAARIMVVHDAGSLADHEVQLLARLVQNFPGANIRIVLLLGTSARSRKIFESFDRRMLRWDIEAPTPDQAEAMLAQGREDGCEGAVKALLQKMQAPEPGEPIQADPAGIDPLGFDAGVTRAPAGTEVFTFSGGADAKKKAKPAQDKVRTKRGRGDYVRWLMAISFLAALSVGTTAWLHPDVFTLDRLQLAQDWARSKLLSAPPAATVVAASAPAVPAKPAEAVPAASPAQEAVLAAVPAASTPPADASPTAPTTAAATAPVPAEPASVPATAAPVAASSPAATVASKPANAAATAQPAKPAAALPAKVAVASEAIEAPAEAMAAQAWLKPMPAGTYVVQHAAMPTYEAAQQWQKSQAALSAARIVAVYRPNQKMAYFVVVSGPFATRELAFNFTRSRGVPADTWVRTAASLREQFTPEQTTAPKR